MISAKLLQSHRKKQPMSGNQEKYNGLQAAYPFEALIIPKLKEESFQKVHPYIWFVRVKLNDGYHWMFKSKKELDIFYAWRRNGKNTQE